MRVSNRLVGPWLAVIAVLAARDAAAAKGQCSGRIYYTPTCASPGGCGSQYAGLDPDAYLCWVGHAKYCWNDAAAYDNASEPYSLTYHYLCDDSVRNYPSKTQQCGTIPDEICGNGYDDDLDGCIDNGCEKTVCGVTCIATENGTSAAASLRRFRRTATSMIAITTTYTAAASAIMNHVRRVMRATASVA